MRVSGFQDTDMCTFAMGCLLGVLIAEKVPIHGDSLVLAVRTAFLAQHGREPDGWPVMPEDVETAAVAMRRALAGTASGDTKK